MTNPDPEPIPVESRDNTRIAKLLEILALRDPDGYSIATDGSLDAMSDDAVIKQLEWSLKFD